MEKNKLIISGATGCLAGNIIRQLNDKYDIIAITKNNEIVNNELLAKCTLVMGIDDFKKAKINFAKSDIVIHTAALYGRNGESVEEMTYANFVFGVELYNLTSQCGKFVNIGTSLSSDVSLYSFTKRQFSKWLEFFSVGAVANVLLEQFYAQDAPITNFIQMVINKCRNNEDILLTKCLQKRDIIHVDDVVNAIQCILESNLTGYNDIPVATGKAVVLRDVVEFIKQITNSTSKLHFGAIKMRKNEPDYGGGLDMGIISSLGFKPIYDYKKGIENIIKGDKS